MEILAPENSAAEVRDKLNDYLSSGVRLLWLVQPKERTVLVSTALDRITVMTSHDTLTGGDVLPRFSLPVAQIFAAR